jgi:hypothetical protein
MNRLFSVLGGAGAPALASSPKKTCYQESGLHINKKNVSCLEIGKICRHETSSIQVHLLSN